MGNYRRNRELERALLIPSTCTAALVVILLVFCRPEETAPAEPPQTTTTAPADSAEQAPASLNPNP